MRASSIATASSTAASQHRRCRRRCPQRPPRACRAGAWRLCYALTWWTDAPRQMAAQAAAPSSSTSNGALRASRRTRCRQAGERHAVGGARGRGGRAAAAGLLLQLLAQTAAAAAAAPSMLLLLCARVYTHAQVRARRGWRACVPSDVQLLQAVRLCRARRRDQLGRQPHHACPRADGRAQQQQQ